jgi:hypothetical protein
VEVIDPWHQGKINPCYVYNAQGEVVARVVREEDAAFIVSARAAEVARLRREYDPRD